MTWSSKLTNQIIQMINIMSPITTSIRTITRKSVNKVAELDNDMAPWTVGQRLEDYSAVITPKPPSEVGTYAVVDWMQCFGVATLARGPAADRMPGRLIGESLDRFGNPTFRLGLQSQEQIQEQHTRLDEDQSTTDTTDLKMTEKTLAKDTAAFEDTTQDCLAIQAKVAEFKNPTKSLSEELGGAISEKTGDTEYRDNRSVLSSRGALAGELIKSEHSIELVQFTSHVASAMHAEKGEAEESEPPYKTARSGDIVMVIVDETFCVSEKDMPKVYYEGDDGQVLPTEPVHEGKKIYSNGDKSSVKVKGLISDVITKIGRECVCGRYPQGHVKCLLNRLDAAVQQQNQGAETLETAQLGAPQRRAAVERRIQCSSHGDLSGVADQWRSCSSGWLP